MNNNNLFTTEELQEVCIEDYCGYWGEVDRLTHNGVTYALFENNTYGDETCYIVAKVRLTNDAQYIPVGNELRIIITSNDIIDETFDGLAQCLCDCGIIDDLDGSNHHIVEYFLRRSTT